MKLVPTQMLSAVCTTATLRVNTRGGGCSQPLLQIVNIRGGRCAHGEWRLCTSGGEGVFFRLVTDDENV
ncbi:MAG: hypothetical protein IJA00_06240 [Bacteroidaceae bacterium]|nr:hypothetical protein [Bacteroidaceae bacterium]